MKRALAIALCLVALTSSARAQEIGFIEDFALAKDRTVPLAQLIPGTEDYYYYHCLHHQNNEQYEQVRELLAAWIKRYNYTPRVKEIQYRQALLTYADHPRESLEFIRQQLNLQFNHQRERPGRSPDLATELDPRLIDRETLTARAMARYQNLQGFEDVALDWLVETQLEPDRRRHLLERLARPDHPNLPQLIVEDLNYRYSKGFGSFAIHGQLLLPQLEDCLRLKSDLLNQTHFVNTYLVKLQPNPDVDWRHDPRRLAEYLDRLWEFVDRLAPVHNSLKAHVLYHRLDFDRSQGVYDKDRFMTYLKLPKNCSYISAEYMKLEENRRYPANLNQNFESLTLFSAVGNDEPLVRAYLHRFFVDEATYKPFEQYVNDIYLRHNFAETKIVNGLGDAERWYSLLPPERYQQLKDRIDLDFAPTNKEVFLSDAVVNLDMHVKNVKTLLVKVYEINAKNYYRQHQREVNADINLDGLVANVEETYEYDVPQLRRVSRHYEFPQLDKPGVYVIDFIGNGRSSRVVVRKGKLRYLTRTSTAGQVFTVLNDRNEVVRDATLWMSGHEYSAGEDGKVVTPYSTNPGRQAIVLSRGDFSSLAHFQHDSEQYQLKAGLYVDRESLLKRHTAKLLVRPGLYLNGTPVSLSLVQEPQLLITSVDDDGVATTKEVKDFELHEDRESIHEFQVPARLAQISFTLSGKVENLSQSKKVDLSVSDTYALNAIDKTDKVEDLHLTRVDGQYYLELLGRTGESRVDRPVRLSLKHRDFRDDVEMTLKTDGQGRVSLGRLVDIDRFAATGPEGTQRAWTLPRDRHTYLTSLNGVVGETIEVPYMGDDEQPTRDELSLLEVRGGTFVSDRFASLGMTGGLLAIKDLPRGDYDLLLKRSGQRVQLRLTDGPSREGYGMGDYRHLELRGERPLQIDSIDTGEQEVTVRLRNGGQFTRVHVFATRYVPAFPAYDRFANVHDVEPYQTTVPSFESLYAEGRNIGDEYRYILERRFATKFPGNMLDRPSLLLNPWAIRKTETGQQVAQAGDDFAPATEAPDAEGGRGSSRGGANGPVGDFANLDFLADASAVLVNLEPDDDGLIAIPRDLIGAHQMVHVVAVDPLSTVYRSVTLPEIEQQFEDLRLLVGLDPEKHFTQQKQISIVRSDQSFEIPDVTTSKFEAYDSLARIYSLYLTLSKNENLAEFGFILNWPTMTPEQKREKYSKYACHELNFFVFKKDPEFFQQVVLPYLRNKMDKTFLDHWLVGDELGEFLKPWNHERLNTVERILLAQRIAGEEQYTATHVRNAFDLIPPDPDRFAYLFNTAIRGNALEAGGSEFEEAKRALGKMLRENAASELQSLAVRDKDADAAAAMPGRAGGGGARFAAPRASARPAAPPAAGEESAEGQANRRAQSRKLAAQLADRLSRDEKGDGNGRDRAFFADDSRNRGLVRQLYQKIDKTMELVENNYYHLPITDQNAELVKVNAVWSDYAGHDPSTPFFTTHLAEATGNFTEMMFALSVLDVPFKSGEHETKFDEAKMTLDAKSPMIVFHEEIRPATSKADQTPILVSQNFFQQNDRYRHENNQRYDKFVTDEFLVSTVYGCQVVMTNPTSSPQKLDVLVQIPVGAFPVMNNQYTESVHVDLQPFNTRTIEYQFYFPAAGNYRHYPVQVSKNEELLASAEPFRFNVVEQLSKIDTESWAYVSQFGDDDQVIRYLTSENLQRIDLSKIAFRMKDKAFFRQVTDLLARRHAYDHTLWSYSILHDVAPEIRQFLRHADAFVAQCGDVLDSPILRIDPVERKTYEFRDYKPMVNARVHQLGQRRRILNDRFHEQYHHLMKILGYGRQLTDEDKMSVTVYMLLQDRVEEAFEFFGQVDRRNLPTQVQYDYLTAYMSFYTEDQQIAADIVAQYADYPVDRWRNSFVEIRNQLDSLKGSAVELADPDSRDQRQAALATTAPNFEFEVEAKKVRVDYQNLDRIHVNYYLMDIELMFSTTPFVKEYGSQIAFIRPNRSQSIELPGDANSLVYDLPQELHNHNVLVEILGGGQTKTQTYYSNSLALQVVENYGQLQVAHQSDRSPISKAYVKVYARMQDGGVRFYKDGYTDVRGRFDYTSLNTNELDFVQKFAILVMSDSDGAIVREANPPKR